MTVKLVMLYPHPVDPEVFDRDYVEHHLPLVRQSVGPGVHVPTYKTLPRGADRGPFYRMAEIHFPDRAAFDEFVHSGRGRAGYQSAKAVSTGGEPVVLVCEEQHEAPE